jgi:ELWxxDGT repeat protein
VSAAVISTSSSSASVGNFLYFGGQSTPTQNTNRAQLWRTDGTPGGTQLVADPAAANASTDISAMNAVRGRVVFQYCTSLPQYHCDVYASDGTAGGTVQIGANGIGMTAILNGPATSPAAQLLYSYNNGSSEVLRVSDGTSAGTRDVKSWPAPAVIYSSTMTAFQGAVVFSMLDPVLGPVIWRSDGTPAGTVLVADIDPGASDQGVPFGFTAAGTNQLLFNGYTRQRGQELYALDTSGPNAADDSIAAPAAIATSIAVLANDGTLVSSVTASTLRIVTAPASGSATVNAANGTISYTGNAGFSGVDQFTYTVNDLLGGVSNVATVFVVVAQPVGGSPGTAPTAPPASGGGGSSTGPTTSGGGGGGLSLTDLLALLGLCLSLRRLSATPATHCPRRQ